MHKQALKQLSDELEKLKHAKDNLPEVIMLVINLYVLVCYDMLWGERWEAGRDFQIKFYINTL